MHITVDSIKTYESFIDQLHTLHWKEKGLLPLMNNSDTFIADGHDLIQKQINNIVLTLIAMNYNEFIHSLDTEE